MVIIYTKNPQNLILAIKNSLDVISIWDGDVLIGLIRTVGDGYTILYIQDILFLKTYQRKGIGGQLIQLILEKYAHIRQIILLTVDEPPTRAFYESLGFESHDKGNLVSFGKIQ